MGENTLVDFQTRVRSLILQFQELKRENEELYVMVEKNENEVLSLKAQIAEKNREFDAFKAAKMLQVADGDLQSAKDRLNKLIRDVNKCISVLSEQK